MNNPLKTDDIIKTEINVRYSDNKMCLQINNVLIFAF